MAFYHCLRITTVIYYGYSKVKNDISCGFLPQKTLIAAKRQPKCRSTVMTGSVAISELEKWIEKR